MIIWIESALAIGIHDRQLAEHTDTGGVRDSHLLESALARPQQRYAYDEPPPDLADLAATLAFGLARNHPFVDGNKRTAAVVCETFIELNGAHLQATDAELFPVFLAVAGGKLELDDFAAWLREHMTLAPGAQVQEAQPAYATRKHAGS